jgi:hypothetical protein
MLPAYIAHQAANDETSLILDYLRECHVDSLDSLLNCTVDSGC